MELLKFSQEFGEYETYDVTETTTNVVSTTSTSTATATATATREVP